MSKIITGMTFLLLLISLLLIGITAVSVISEDTPGAIDEESLDHFTEETIEKISTYIQIRGQIGKFYNVDGEQKIEKIALLISPMFTQEISINELTIQLNDGKNVRVLNYNGDAENIGSNSLFEHPIWSNITGENLGFLSINDLDDSLVNNDIINDYSDNAYLLIRLPTDMTLASHDKITITLFPSTGITRIIELQAPLPIKSIVTFE